MNLNAGHKSILVAPLNWGLGHATRCIPIIKALQQNNYIPIIASDGIALALLKKEFPTLQLLELPSYQIEYTKKGENLKWKLLQNGFKTIKAIRREKLIIESWIEKHNINGIISDNRLGVFSSKIPSIYITHQLNVLTGNTTWITSKIHRYIIKKHTECWVPDLAGVQNFTGKLGHLENTNLNIKYIGPLSRLHKKETEKKYDLMIILSGPEPQRGILEAKLKIEILRYSGKIIFIKGVVEKNQIKEQIGNVIYYNFMNSDELEHAFNESEKVLCRSGYTTVMDLVQLEKKAFFIPTPGQYEQEFLAEKLMKDGLAPYAIQEDFSIEDIQETQHYKGFTKLNSAINWHNLFTFFEK